MRRCECFEVFCRNKEPQQKGVHSWPFLVFQYTDCCRLNDCTVIIQVLPLTVFRSLLIHSLYGLKERRRILVHINECSLFFAQQKQKLKCSTEQQLRVDLIIYLFSLRGNLVHFDFANLSCLYEFVLYPVEIHVTGICHTLQSPRSQPQKQLAIDKAPIAWDGRQAHIIEGIRREQKFLCFIYSIIVEGWKAVSQLCLGVDLQ